MGGKDSGGPPPPLPGVRSSSGGSTRRRCLRSVPRRRGWRRRTRASGEKRGCLGGSWEWGEFVRLIGGGFYRPEGRGQGRPVGGRRRVCWRRARARPGTAALLACWRGSVSATECCGSALARSRRSAACREQRDREGGSGCVLPPLLQVSRLGSGQRGLGSTAGVSTSMATGSRPRVRSNARKKLKFEFLKFFTLGGQHIRQGFQRYFCYKKRLSFAEIIFQIFGYCHCFRFKVC
jgi:hypothetical protein